MQPARVLSPCGLSTAVAPARRETFDCIGKLLVSTEDPVENDLRRQGRRGCGGGGGPTLQAVSFNGASPHRRDHGDEACDRRPDRIAGMPGLAWPLRDRHQAGGGFPRAIRGQGSQANTV
jgi:hypothetical protein